MDSRASRDNTLLNTNIKTNKAFKVTGFLGGWGEGGQQVHIWTQDKKKQTRGQTPQLLTLIIKMVSALISQNKKKSAKSSSG